MYFENALAVYARLLFFKTSITGVQVLTLMVGVFKRRQMSADIGFRLTTPRHSQHHVSNTCYLPTLFGWLLPKVSTEQHHRLRI